MNNAVDRNRNNCWQWPAVVAALCAVLPLLAAVASYLISATLNQVPWCWPMFEGCTSISRAGRNEPAIFIFRLLLLPQAVLLVLCWALVRGWLHQRGINAGQTRNLLIAGVVGALALALYVDFLGSNGEFYQFMRRFGITFYFAGTGLAQLMTVRLLRPQGGQSVAQLWLWYLVLGQWLLAIVHVVLKIMLADYDRWENRLEWSLALLMTLWFAALAWQFHRDRVQVVLTRQ